MLEKRFEMFTIPEKMMGVFQAVPAIYNTGLRIAACKILRTRFKTYLKPKSYHKSFLTACYEITVENMHSETRMTQIFYLRAYLDGRSMPEYRLATSKNLVEPRFGKAVTHLPALDAVIYAFPNDPELPHLGYAIKGVRLIDYLPYRALPSNLDAPKKIPIFETEVVQYYPEQRCTNRYRLYSTNHQAEPFTIYGKTYRDQRGAEICRQIMQYCELSKDNPAMFSTARPLGYTDAIKTLWLGGVKCEPLNDYFSGGNHLRLMEKTGEGLALFHQHPITDKADEPRDEMLADLLKKHQKITAAFPQLHDSLAALKKTLLNYPPFLPAANQRQLHGDFHLNQLQLRRGKIFLFDFDEIALGDPAKDLASFTVDLHLHGFPTRQVDEMTDAFYRGYHAGANREIDPQRLYWHTCAQLLTKAYRVWSYRRDRKALSVEIGRLLGLARKMEKRFLIHI